MKTLENIAVTRLAALVLALLFIPAFVAGAVSVWCVLFSLAVALRFRAGLIDLNRRLDAAADGGENLSRPRLRFWGLVGECVLYSYLAFGIFLTAYGGGFLPWPGHATGIDQMIDFPENFYFIGSRPDVDFHASMAPYLVGVINYLYGNILFLVFLFSYKELCSLNKKKELIFNLFSLDIGTGYPSIPGVFLIVILVLIPALTVIPDDYIRAYSQIQMNNMLFFHLMVSLSWSQISTVFLVTHFYFNHKKEI